MIFIISPAKGFNDQKYIKELEQFRIIKNSKSELVFSIPSMKKYSKEILKTIKRLSKDDIARIMNVNKDIAEENFNRYQNYSFADENSMQSIANENTEIDHTPSIFSYSGLQYKNMMLEKMNRDDLKFLSENFRILSGLYGVLKPFDLIKPYRLEMLTKIDILDKKNLYEFWGDKIYKNIKTTEDNIIVNLASEEYAKSIRKYAKKDGVKLLDIVFKIRKNNTLKSHSTYSKMARGNFLYYSVKNKIRSVDEMKKFNLDGWKFLKSDDNGITFVKEL